MIRSRVAPFFLTRLLQGRIGLPLQSALHTTDLDVTLMGEPAAARHTLRELFECERQQRKGGAAAGIGDEAGHQFIVDLESRYLRGLFDDRP